MLKLQLLSDGVRSEHSLAATGAAPSISTAIASVGGVYTDKDEFVNWMEWRGAGSSVVKSYLHTLSYHVVNLVRSITQK